MTKLVHLLRRKPASPAETPAQIAASAAPAPAIPPPETSEIELDQDLFFPIATQLGEENETVRNLLMDAEHKIGELDIIKRSIGRLVDPVTKTLRAYEESKSEKLSLQGVLNNTRVAHNKLRDDLGLAEKKAANFEAKAIRLKEILEVAKQSVSALERTKTEQIAELAARRTQIAELQRQTQQQGADLELTRNENRRLGERIAAADKRTVQLEGQAQTAQQKAMQADKERAAVQASLDKAQSELAQTSRRLNDNDKTLAMAQARLKTVETGLAEAQAERVRLAAALDEANHKRRDETNLQNSRYDALQARAGMTEGLLEEARQTLMARADEVRAFERRVIETSTALDDAGERLSQATAALAQRELQLKDFEQAHAALSEQTQMLTHAVTVRESAYNNAQQKIQDQSDLVELLEKQIRGARDANEMQIAQLQRERLERSMAEGALEACRKDIARLMRELAAQQYRPRPAGPAEAPPRPPHLRSVA